MECQYTTRAADDSFPEVTLYLTGKPPTVGYLLVQFCGFNLARVEIVIELSRPTVSLLLVMVEAMREDVQKPGPGLAACRGRQRSCSIRSTKPVPRRARFGTTFAKLSERFAKRSRGLATHGAEQGVSDI